MKNEKSKMQKRRLSEDERGVSPVVGVIMMVAITVVIAAVVAAFSYGIIGGVQKAPNTAIVVDNAVSGSAAKNVTMIHHGGDKIIDAFTTASDPTGLKWNKLEVRYNGEVFNGSSYLNNVGNGTAWDDGNFEPGDELKLTFADGLADGESIAVVYKPTGDLLQRVVVT